LRTLEEHTKAVRTFAYSPDGRLLASCGDDRTILLWRVEDGAQECTLEGVSRSARAVALSPDGSGRAGPVALKLWWKRKGALDAVTIVDARGFFGHCGYRASV